MTWGNPLGRPPPYYHTIRSRKPKAKSSSMRMTIINTIRNIHLYNILDYPNAEKIWVPPIFHTKIRSSKSVRSVPGQFLNVSTFLHWAFLNWTTIYFWTPSTNNILFSLSWESFLPVLEKEHNVALNMSRCMYMGNQGRELLPAVI